MTWGYGTLATPDPLGRTVPISNKAKGDSAADSVASGLALAEQTAETVKRIKANKAKNKAAKAKADKDKKKSRRIRGDAQR